MGGGLRKRPRRAIASRTGGPASWSEDDHRFRKAESRTDHVSRSGLKPSTAYIPIAIRTLAKAPGRTTVLLPSVPVPVMGIRVMRVRMDERRVAVPMRMRLRGGLVAVPMVLVVLMPMLVLHGFMGMFVVMSFGHMQIDAQRHQRSCNQQLSRDRLSQHENRESSAEEWG